MVEKTLFKTIPDFLDNSAKLFADKICLTFEGKNYTYLEVKKRADNIFYFLSNQAKKGDVIALLLENKPELIFSYFGVLSAGCIALLLPSNISDASFLYQLDKTKPKLIISSEKYRPKFERTGILKDIRYINYEEIPESNQTAPKNILESDVSTIIFTSGTTSYPKGAKLCHCNVVAATKNIVDFLEWNKNDIDVNILPLSHSFGLGNIHCIFAVGGRVILFRDAINLKEIFSQIIEYKATTFSATPTTLRLIIENYVEDFKKCGESLRFVQTDTSLLDKEFIKKIISVLTRTDFNYYYGLTEASRSTFITLNKHLDKIGSVGQAAPNVKIKIVNENNEVLPSGQAGEICIKGEHIIKEYWQNSEASQVIKNGWLHTSDTGYLDSDGYLYFKGRKDDIINVSGEKVSPEEIEGVIKEIAGVKDVAVIGIPDRLLGEVVKAFVVVEDKNIEPENIFRECRDKLESYKVPRKIEIINEIPRTDNGKIKRNLLKNKV